MDLDYSNSMLGEVCFQLECDSFGMSQASYILAWAFVRSCLEGENDISILSLQLSDQKPSHFNCHVDPSQSIAQSIQLINSTKSDGYVEKESQAAVSLLLLDVNPIDHDYSKFFSKYPVSHILRIGLYAETSLLYKENYAEKGKAKRMVGCFTKCLHQIRSYPHRRLADIDITSEPDLERIYAWNNRIIPAEHDLIHRIVFDHDRNATAIESWDGTLTYGALEQVSTRLAHHLRNFGVRRESVVPLLFHRSAWAVVAMLAVLKAGGAVLALNADTPEERIRDILIKAKSSLMIASPELMYRVESLPIVHVILTQKLMTSIPYDIRVLDQNFSTDAAFVIFTSGSTGSPKGFTLEHGAFCTSARAMHKSLRMDKHTRCFQFASFSFDATQVEIFMTLMAGGCVCIPSEHARLNDIERTISSLNVNWMIMTPTLAASLDPSMVTCVKTLCIAGEAPTEKVISLWADRVHLINAYGPAECCPISAVRDITTTRNHPRNNIGWASQNAILWLVMPDNPCVLAPIGAVGEIMIQGPCLGRGYLGNPEQTRATFLRGINLLNSSVSKTLPTLYRTGDLGRYQEDGSIEYIARKDSQVKIRSQRIELGEIESQIERLAHDNYAAAVDITSPLSGSETQKVLTAFLWRPNQQIPWGTRSSILSPDSDFLVEVENIKGRMKTVLPNYMIPNLFISIDGVPRNASGKVDRRQLRAMATDLPDWALSPRFVHGENIDPPKAEAELKLQRVWAKFFNLQAEDVSMKSDFFHLGGDSIAAMRLSKLARADGLSLTVADVLEYHDFRAQSALIEERSHIVTKEPAYYPFIFFEDSMHPQKDVCLKAAGKNGKNGKNGIIEDIYPATDFQVAKLATWTTESRGGTNYVLLDFKPPRHSNEISNILSRVINEFAIFRTVFAVSQRRVYQVILKNLPELEIFDINPGELLDKLTDISIQEDKERPVHLETSVFRMWGFQKDAKLDRVVLRLNQALYDGITLYRFMRSFCDAYNTSRLDTTSNLPSYLHSINYRTIDISQNYWRDLLQGSSMTRILNHSSPSHSHVLDGAVKEVIPNFTSQIPEITIASIIKAAWALVLSSISGSSDVVFGVTTWGRNAPGGDNVMGSCMDTVPVRIKLSSDSSPLNLLKEVQSQAIASIPHEMFGYQRIVELCTNWRRWERLSSILMYQNLDENTDEFALGNGSVRLTEVRSQSDRADLAVYTRPHEGGIWLEINYNESLIPMEFAEALLKGLVFAIQSLNYSESISLPRSDLEICTPISIDSKSLTQRPSFGTYQKVDRDRYQMAKRLVSDAWTECLMESSPLQTNLEDKSDAFFDLWGSPLAAYALKVFYDGKGFMIGIEDLFKNPTMGLQEQLLYNRISGDSSLLNRANGA